MKPNTAKIRIYLGIKGLEFNLESNKAYVIRLDQELIKAKINDLRYAIFQTGEDTAELKDAKRRMIDELRYAERCLLKNYLRTTPDIEEIRNSLNKMILTTLITPPMKDKLPVTTLAGVFIDTQLIHVPALMDPYFLTFMNEKGPVTEDLIEKEIQSTVEEEGLDLLAPKE
ncbi:hypothetical protein AgCh_038595 [Apium graveolens]